nr:EamA family transporter [uncultured Treponema sp.]
MKTNSNIPYFILMHISFLIYSGYALCGKFASTQEFLSKNFILLYGAVMFIMCVYAILWQQVLKRIPLSVASANKSITIIWGILFGKIVFDEKIKLNMILGAAIILTGLFILLTENEEVTE